MLDEPRQSDGRFGSRLRIAVAALLLVVIMPAAAQTPDLLKDINFATASSTPEGFTEVNGVTFFSVTQPCCPGARLLFKTDGTTDGTEAVTGGDPFIRTNEQFGVLGGELIFPGSSIGSGRELWKSDGTLEGTVLVKDINPTGDGIFLITPFIEMGGFLYFLANDGVHGNELWRTNGIPDGEPGAITEMVKDINPGAADGDPGRANSGSPVENIVNLNGTLIFNADGGLHPDDQSSGNDVGLWRSDGTEAGTVLILDQPDTSASPPTHLTVFNGHVYFSSNPDDPDVNCCPERKLWRTDGTAAGTGLFKEINDGVNRGSGPGNLTVVGDTLFFTATSNFTSSQFGNIGGELFKTDGTAGGTVLVKDINPGSSSSSPDRLTNADGTLFFWANDGTHGRELWKSDGTPGGTALVMDINPGSSGTIASELTALGGKVYFGSHTGDNDRELWRSDGTEAGTFEVVDLNTGGSSMPLPTRMGAVNGILFFSGDDGTTGFEPWKLIPPIEVDEICDNGIDDDGDGDVDGDDSDCMEICDNGLDDDGDGLVDDDDPDCAEPLVRCFHTPVYSPNAGEIFTIHASAIDRTGADLVVESLEIWLGFDQSGPQATANDSHDLSLEYPAAGNFSYGCRATNGGDSHFSGMRSVAVGEFNFPAIPVLINGGLARKIDVIFYADQDEYSSFTDPAFLEDVGLLISEGYWTIPWFVEFQDYFNFWIGKANDANSGPDPDSEETDPNLILCLREPPSDFFTRYLFADVSGIVHRSVCRDNAGSGSFTIEMDLDRLQVVAHESGHRPFGLADEYCCNASYYSNPPSANLLSTEAQCILEAGARGFNPADCRLLQSSVEDNDTQGWIFEPDYGTFSPRVPDLMQQTGCATLETLDPLCEIQMIPDITGLDENPNGLYACDVAGTTYVGDTDGTLDPGDFYWMCQMPGNAANAVWQAVRSRFEHYDVGPSELDRLSWFLSNCDGGSC